MKVLGILVILLLPEILFGISDQYKKFNRSFVRSERLKTKGTSEIIYGNPKIGFFKPNSIKTYGDEISIKFIPPTYKHPVYFYAKAASGKYIKLKEKNYKSPLLPAFNIIQIKVSGEFSDSFYLMSGSLPRSRFKDYNNSELKPDLPLLNRKRFTFSMVVNRLGEIVWVYVPTSNGMPFKMYPVIEPLGDGLYGVLFGKKSSAFVVFDWQGLQQKFLDLKTVKNGAPIHHDFIAFQGDSFVTFSYDAKSYGTNKSFVTSTLVRTYIDEKRTEILKDFGKDFNPQEINWKEEKEAKKHFWSFTKPKADHDFDHANGLKSTPWGHLVSFRHLSKVVLLKKKSLETLWKLFCGQFLERRNKRRGSPRH